MGLSGIELCTCTIPTVAYLVNDLGNQANHVREPLLTKCDLDFLKAHLLFPLELRGNRIALSRSKEVFDRLASALGDQSQGW
jgi:hypothetical protein